MDYRHAIDQIAWQEEVPKKDVISVAEALEVLDGPAVYDAATETVSDYGRARIVAVLRGGPLVIR